MTPEQTTELIKALNQHNWFPVICGIIWLLGTILQFLIVSRFKSAIENKQHFTRSRFASEMEIYQKVWPKLMNFFQATYLSEDIDQTSTQNRYAEARDAVIRVIRENLPFFAKEIRQEILAFQLLCEQHRNYESIMRRSDLKPDELKNYLTSHDKIKNQLDKVEEAIRNRLSKFD